MKTSTRQKEAVSLPHLLLCVGRGSVYLVVPWNLPWVHFDVSFLVPSSLKSWPVYWTANWRAARPAGYFWQAPPPNFETLTLQDLDACHPEWAGVNNRSNLGVFANIRAPSLLPSTLPMWKAPIEGSYTLKLEKYSVLGRVSAIIIHSFIDIFTYYSIYIQPFLFLSKVPRRVT